MGHGESIFLEKGVDIVEFVKGESGTVNDVWIRREDTFGSYLGVDSEISCGRGDLI